VYHDLFSGYMYFIFRNISELLTCFLELFTYNECFYFYVFFFCLPEYDAMIEFSVKVNEINGYHFGLHF
jgi:hypothetical protein